MNLRYFWPGLIWSTVIFILCSIPGDMVPSFTIWDFLSFDKLAHFGVFMIHSFLWVFAFRKQYFSKTLRLHAKRIGIFMGIFYGVGLEFWQSTLSNGRVADIADMIANAIGCLVGVLLFQNFLRLLPAKIS